MTSLKNNLVYLQYLLRHKAYVLRECWRRRLFWRGLAHDWSKFLPDEFFIYAEYWLEWGWPRLKDSSICIPPRIREQFRHTTDRHKRRNRHHWEYWVTTDRNGEPQAKEMDPDSVLEMLCDWEAVGRMFHGTPGAHLWYQRHGHEMDLASATRQRLEELLDLFPEE